ncbi:MAG: ABC transporter substrate-binding protein [Roseitalea sp.]|nr:ABC transporter substrate-binding protein [Roseitalea sp.]MBO6721628.1 ABC transporter substrate-binding protein [Roseitalea sp.]MBO6743384.1 ABC transporter substrate-binding protein [Roseitalea sp.]
MHKALRKRSLLGATAMLFAVLNSQTALAEDKIIYQLGWVPGGTNGPIYYGIEQGYFAEEGLEIEVRSGEGSSDAINRVASGAADIGVTGIEAVLAAGYEGQLPVRVIFGLYSAKPDAIFTTADSDIDSIDDLAGRRVATATFSNSNIVWPLIAEMNGLDLENVEVIQVDAASVAPMLAAGRVDAAISWVTVGPLYDELLAETGDERVALPWSDFGYSGYGQTLVANTRLIEENPELLERFVRAYARSVAGAAEDPAAAGAAITALVPEIDAEVAGAEFAASVPLIFNDISAENGVGMITKGRLEETWDWVARSQDFDADALDPMTMVEMQFVEAMQ